MPGASPGSLRIGKRYAKEFPMDWKELRGHFPVTEEYIFFNNAGICPIPDTAGEALAEFARSVIYKGSVAVAEWKRKEDTVRAALARFIGAKPEEIAFEGSTSFGLSAVASGFDWKPGDNVVIPDQEFPSNVYPWLNLERLGVEVRRWESRGNRLLVDDLRRIMDGRTRMVSLSAVQWSSGFRADLAAVSQLVHERDALLAVDVIQHVGAIPLDVKSLGIDFAAADGHKWMLSVEGAGFFFCDENALNRIHPVIVGWKSVVNAHVFHEIDFTLLPTAERFEHGSINTGGLYPLAIALDMLENAGMDRVFRRILDINDLLVQGIEERNMKVLSPMNEAERSGILIFTTGRDEELFKHLTKRGLVASLRGGGIRLSPHCYNNEEDVERFFAALDEAK